MRTWRVVLSLLVCVGALALVVRVYSRSSERSGPHPCLSNLHALATAMRMYVADCGRFPSASTWMDALSDGGYVIDPRVFHCPLDKTHKYSYAMNSKLSAVKPPHPRRLPHVVLFFPSDFGKRNASGLPAVGECRPHGGGEDMCVVAYADGDAVMLAPGERPEPMSPSAKRPRNHRKSRAGVEPRRPARQAEPSGPAK